MNRESKTLIDATVELSVAVSRLTGAGQREVLDEARQLAASIADECNLRSDNHKALLAAAEVFGAPFPIEDDQQFPTLPGLRSTLSSVHRERVHAALFHKVERVRVGPFILSERLGAGGLGEVYAAYDERLDRRVALKLVRHGAGATAHADDLLLREAQALAQVSHPNIVQIYEAGIDDGRVFIAMELIRGQTLTRWLKDASQMPRAHRQREVLRRFIAAGRGLEAAHAAGIAHRDFKPDNVLVGQDGRVCLVDFGLADISGDAVPPVLVGPTNDGGSYTTELLAHSRLTVTGPLVGTPRFMAPEQLRGDAVDHRSDQFSFCVALYHALYGTFPFAGEHLQQLLASMEAGVMCLEHAPTLAGDLRKALCRGLSIDPSKRFASMSELLAELERSSWSSRQWIARTSVGSIAAAAVLMILGTVVGNATMSELIFPSLGLLTTLIGTALGFYFGRITRPRD